MVGPGTEFNYALRYVNKGTAPASKTWVIDRMPDGASVIQARGPVRGEVWFAPDLWVDPSNHALGYLQALSPGFTYDDAFVCAPGRFTRRTARPDPTNDPGLCTPSIANAKWVAFLVDDPDFDPNDSPPIFGVGLDGTLDIRVKVAASAPVGMTLENEALIDSAELLQSIGNRVDDGRVVAEAAMAALHLDVLSCG